MGKKKSGAVYLSVFILLILSILFESGLVSDSDR
jgi:hypothetical protein